MKTSRTSKQKATRRLLIIGALLLGAVAGYFVARRVAWPAYRDWRTARINRLAEQFLAAGNFDKALLTVRNNLRDNQRDLATWRLAARIATAGKLPDEVYYLDHLAKVQKTLAARLDVLRAALRHGYVGNALEVVDAVGVTGADSAEFQALAAEACEREERLTEAKQHLTALVRLQPGDGKAQLDLAELEFREATGRTDAGWRERIRRAAGNETLRARALALLLAEAIMRPAPADALALADEFQAKIPSPAPQDRILILRGLALGAPERTERYLARLGKDLTDDPTGAALLVRYELEAGQLAAAARWHAGLPEKIRSAPAVMQAMADVMIARRDWPALTRSLANANWGRKDYERHADLAYAARSVGMNGESANEWSLAVIQAGANVPTTTDLMARITTWGWKEERYDLLWKLFALLPRNVGLRQQLAAWERQQGHTPNLNRIFSRIVEIEPDNFEARNNFAYTSLLLDANVRRACQIAADDFKSDPKNPFYVTVQSLALHKQGQSREALALIESLGLAAQSEPERRLLRAVFHAATGDVAGADSLIAGLPPGRFLPEERTLATQSAATVARLEKEQALQQRLVADRAKGPAGHHNGWLQILPAVRATAQPAMLQAEEYYAASDFTGLGGLLRSSTWAGAEHLRLALLAYVKRSAGDEVQAREQWRAALGDAGSASTKLLELAELARQWNWSAERLETVDRLFERNPRDPQMLAELIEYHRAAGRTADLARVLSGYVSASPVDDAMAGKFAYYSMLSDLNLARAYVVAKRNYEAAPGESGRQLVYAFSLWKQNRAGEAWQLLEKNADAPGDGIVPGALLRAAVLVELGRQPDARRELGRYHPEHALPEETRLASTLARKLSGVAGMTSL